MEIDYEKDINVKNILGVLFLLGVVTIAATSPYFLYRLAKILFKNNKLGQAEKKKFRSSFYYLTRNNLVKIERNNHDIKFCITKKGVTHFRKYQINEMEIKRIKKWDKKWYVVIFDISDTQRLQRNAFRWKLKSLGFYSLQKSVWLHAFECKKEIQILVDFLKIDKSKIQILVVDEIGNNSLEEKLKKIYKLQ